MYFPSDMNFQYFFFTTYVGYFLQVLPITLVAGIIYVLYKTKQTPKVSVAQVIMSSLFVCYVVGLLCMTLFINFIGDIYYYLFYHMQSGRGYQWFTFSYNFIPNFFFEFDSENLGNILLYLPFGFLYPLFRNQTTWKRTILVGIFISTFIELIQPILGRSFDINDIILNGVGVVISTIMYSVAKKGASSFKRNHNL